MREVRILTKLRHTNVIRLKEAFEQGDSHLVLMMELVKGDELFDSIISRGRYSEADAKPIFAQLVRYVHPPRRAWQTRVHSPRVVLLQRAGVHP